MKNGDSPRNEGNDSSTGPPAGEALALPPGHRVSSARPATTVKADAEAILVKWRSRAVLVSFLVVVLVGLPAYASTLVNAVQNRQLNLLVGLYLIIYLAFIVLAFATRLDFRLRAWSFLLLGYANATASFLRLGLAGSGRLYLIFLPILATMLLGVRAGYVAAAGSVVLFVLMTVLLQFGVLQNSLTLQANPTDLAFWVEAGTALAVFLALSVVSLSSFYSLLLKAFAARRKASAELEQMSVSLYETTLGIMSRLDTTELLETIVGRAINLVDCSYGWVYLVTPDKEAMEVRVGTGLFHRYVGLKLKRGEGLVGAIWERGEPLAVGDYQGWPQRSLQFEGDPVGPAIGVPLKSGSEVSGVIGLTRPPGSPLFSPDELTLMTRFAQLASIALENSRLHTSLQEELAIEAGQRQFLELLARGGDLHEILHSLIDIIEGQWPGMLGLVLLLDEDGKHLHLGAADGLPQEYVDSIEGLEIGPMVGSCGTACFRRERVIVIDIATDPRWEGLRELALKYGLRSCWSEPVFSSTGELIGTFAMYYRQPRVPSDAELATIQTGAHLVGIAVEQKRAQQALEAAYETSERRVHERTRELATLNAVANSVNRSLDIREVLSDALEKTMQAVDVEFGAAYRLDGDIESMPEARLAPVPNAQTVGQETAAEVMQSLTASPPHPAHLTPVMMTPTVYRGLSQEFTRTHGGMPLPADTLVIAARIGEPYVYMIEGSVTEGEFKRAIEREGIRQVVSVPLVVKTKCVGALNLATARPRTFTSEQLSLLSSIGRQVGMAVENARLYDQARESAQVAERSRLARELHDSVSQSLYSVTLYTEAAARLLKAGRAEEATSHLRDVRQTAQEALREMRLLIFQLRPPALESSTLSAALQARLDAVERRGGIQATLQVIGEEQLSRMVQDELYHIAQEALNNALKHARAQKVQVELRFQPGIATLEVCDDGTGFEPEVARLGGGYGISGMNERASRIGGSISIQSVPGQGTRVSVRVPIESPSQGGSK